MSKTHKSMESDDKTTLQSTEATIINNNAPPTPIAKQVQKTKLLEDESNLQQQSSVIQIFCFVI